MTRDEFYARLEGIFTGRLGYPIKMVDEIARYVWDEADELFKDEAVKSPRVCCSDCHFFVYDNSPRSNPQFTCLDMEHGICHRNPVSIPRAVYDWCGEFKAKDGK